MITSAVRLTKLGKMSLVISMGPLRLTSINPLIGRIGVGLRGEYSFRLVCHTLLEVRLGNSWHPGEAQEFLEIPRTSDILPVTRRVFHHSAALHTQSAPTLITAGD